LRPVRNHPADPFGTGSDVPFLLSGTARRPAIRPGTRPWSDRDWPVVESQRNRGFGWGPPGRAL